MDDSIIRVIKQLATNWRIPVRRKLPTFIVRRIPDGYAPIYLEFAGFKVQRVVYRPGYVLPDKVLEQYECTTSWSDSPGIYVKFGVETYHLSPHCSLGHYHDFAIKLELV